MTRLHPAFQTWFERDKHGYDTGSIIYRCGLCEWAWRANHIDQAPEAIAEAHAHLTEEHAVDETPPPADPFTAIAMAAASMHEMYVSLLAAGFTEPQAVYLVGQALTGGKGTPPA